MKMNHIITVIFIILLSIDICPQNLAIVRLKGTYNFFAMSDETAMQNDLLKDLKVQGIPAIATESFPPYYGLQLQLVYIIKSNSGKEYHLGFFFDQASTGGRIDYKDYSGEIKVDQLFKAFSFGPTGELNKDLGGNFNCTLGLSIPLIFGSIGVKNESRIGNNINTQQVDFLSFTVGIESGITFSYLLQNISIGINLDRLIAFSSSYTLDTNSDVKLLNNAGDPVTMGMNGPRFGLTLGYSF